MSSISYNGVNLGMVKTVRIDQKPHYDDSGTDVLWFVYTLRAQTIFAVAGGTTIPFDGLGGTTAAEVMERLRHMLLVPRRTFTYDCGMRPDFLTVPGGLDAANGPKPLRCDITQATDSTFRVEFDIEICLADCDDVSNVFASNRWEQTTDYDERGYSVITTSGILWTRSDMRVNPDQLRGICAPPLPPDFRRRSSYTLQKDGLALRYQFVDTEKYMLPPEGCVDAQAKCRTVCEKDCGVARVELDISLEGNKEMDKKDLMMRAVIMAINRIEKLAPMMNNATGKPFIDVGAYEEDLFENKVSLRIEARLQTTAWLSGQSMSDLEQVGRDAAEGGIDAAIAAALGKDSADELARLRRKLGRKAKLDKQWAEALRRRAARAAEDASGVVGIVNVPPFLRAVGEPLTGTEIGRPGIDPGIRGNLPFLEMVAAAFSDPCIDAAIGRNLRGHLNQPAGQLTTGNGQQVGSMSGSGSNPTTPGVTNSLKTPGGSTLVSGGLDFVIGDNLLFSQISGPYGMEGYDAFPGVYEHWTCDIKQAGVTSNFVMRATVPGEPAVSGKYANDGLRVKVEWTAVKTGFPPEVPCVFDDNLVPIKTTIVSPCLKVAGDGGHVVYAMSGVTELEALDPEKVTLRQAIPPWVGARMRSIPAPIPLVLDLSTEPFTETRLKSGGELPATTNRMVSPGLVNA